MPFVIPNEASAGFGDQAEPDSIDFSIMAAAAQRSGVVSGCGVTAQGSPDMTVAVAAGIVMVKGLLVVVAAGNVTIGTANATNPRFDLVVVDNAGAKSVTAGTAAANAVFPAIPANSVVLAAVYVPANDTTINSNQITDKGLTISPHGAVLGTKLSDTTTVNTTTETVVFSVTVPGGLLAAGDILRMHWAGNILQSSGAGATHHPFRAGFGTTVLTSTGQNTVTNAIRMNFAGYTDLIAVDATNQRVGVTGIVMQASATPFGPHAYGWGGQGTTAENTATSKVFEWRVKMDTANASFEIVAKQASVILFKATG